MKRLFIIAMACMAPVLSGTAVHAADNREPIRISPHVRPAPAGQSLFDQYNASHRNTGLPGRIMLDQVTVLRLPKTVENIGTVRVLLASKITDDEKVALIRILADMYRQPGTSELNEAILSDLRSLAASGSKELRTAAIFGYTRSGYFPDSVDVLTTARNVGLGDDVYYGELAHLFFYAPADAQERIVNTLKSGRNSYAAAIVAGSAQNRELLEKLSPQTVKTTLLFLEENEPKFPLAIGELGPTIQYGQWLHAVAALNSATGNTDYGAFVVERLNNDRTDPRKIIGYFLSGGSYYLQADPRLAQLVQELQRRMERYAAQFPSNPAIQEFVSGISATLKAAKP